MDHRMCGATAPPTWMWRSVRSRGKRPILSSSLRLVRRRFRRRAQTEPAVRAFGLRRRSEEAVPARRAIDLAARVEVDVLETALRRRGGRGIAEQLRPIVAQEVDSAVDLVLGDVDVPQRLSALLGPARRDLL